MSQLEGAFALLIKSTHFPDELVAAKKGSPLLLGAPPSPHECTPQTSLLSPSAVHVVTAGGRIEELPACFIAP